MIYFILVVLFISVFVFIGWRIFASTPSPRTPAEPGKYICTVCNSRHCECRKDNDGG